MEDDKRVNYKLDAINKLINNLKLSISGNKEHDELGENNIIVNLDEISQKITELHKMVKAEFDEFENQHKSESDETQTLLTKKFDLIHSDLATISDKLTTIDTNIKNMSSALQDKFNALIAAVNAMKASNDTKNDALIAAVNAMKSSNDTKNDAIIIALRRLLIQVNQNTNNINSLNGRVDALEQD